MHPGIISGPRATLKAEQGGLLQSLTPAKCVAGFYAEDESSSRSFCDISVREGGMWRRADQEELSCPQGMCGGGGEGEAGTDSTIFSPAPKGDANHGCMAHICPDCQVSFREGLLSLASLLDEGGAADVELCRGRKLVSVS